MKSIVAERRIMDFKEVLFKFENKYSFLYELEVNGVPFYTCHRDVVLRILIDGEKNSSSAYKNKKGRVYFFRFLEGVIKLRKFRKRKTLIFTSSMYRRDDGRNLAAEFLMDHYDDAVIYEWPSRNNNYDVAYFRDKKRAQYCPLDIYIVFYKLYRILHKHDLKTKEQEYRKEIEKRLDKICIENTNNEKLALAYLIRELPKSYVEIGISQEIFSKIFRKYKNIHRAIDFWGSARENIIPVLPGKPESIELQHGIITNYHTGYIYPVCANRKCNSFFERKILVYGNRTKNLLTNESIFKVENVEIIGNPRIAEYKKEYVKQDKGRNLILFCSQPFEQDGRANNYYETVIPILNTLEEVVRKEKLNLNIGIKLHPRENNGVKELYMKKLQNVTVFDNTSQLYDLLSYTFVQITVNSTTLYEAAAFETPTVTISFNGINMKNEYGFDVWEIKRLSDVKEYLDLLSNKEEYSKYLNYFKENSLLYM